jgi:hypothetical protein
MARKPTWQFVMNRAASYVELVGSKTGAAETLSEAMRLVNGSDVVGLRTVLDCADKLGVTDHPAFINAAKIANILLKAQKHKAQ